MAKTVRVAACQVPDTRENLETALSTMKRYCNEAESRGASLVVFPECFLQGYLLTDERARRFALDLTSPEFDRVLKRFAGFALTVVFGMIEIDNGQLYNTAAVLERSKLMGRYRKTHLLKGETFFEPGTAYPVFEANGLKFGINICYDTNFPESVDALARQGAGLIVCPANNMMPRAKSEHWKHLHNEVRAQRAKESGLWLVSADVTGKHGGYVSYGPTAVINPEGCVVAQVPLLEAGMGRRRHWHLDERTHAGRFDISLLCGPFLSHEESILSAANTDPRLAGVRFCQEELPRWPFP